MRRKLNARALREGTHSLKNVQLSSVLSRSERRHFLTRILPPQATSRVGSHPVSDSVTLPQIPSPAAGLLGVSALEIPPGRPHATAADPAQCLAGRTLFDVDTSWCGHGLDAVQGAIANRDFAFRRPAAPRWRRDTDNPSGCGPDSGPSPLRVRTGCLEAVSPSLATPAPFRSIASPRRRLPLARERAADSIPPCVATSAACESSPVSLLGNSPHSLSNDRTTRPPPSRRRSLPSSGRTPPPRLPARRAGRLRSRPARPVLSTSRRPPPLPVGSVFAVRLAAARPTDSGRASASLARRRPRPG